MSNPPELSAVARENSLDGLCALLAEMRVTLSTAIGRAEDRLRRLMAENRKNSATQHLPLSESNRK